jgi:nucleotide-binding universal stress UspA family protein
MTIVVGYAPAGRGRAVLHLAGMLARSGDEELVLCAVVPEPWPPSPARVDAEYQAHVEREAAAVLDRARERIGDDLTVSTSVHRSRSVPAGLLEVAERHDTNMLVAGSATAGGPGSVALGSTTSRLLHSSPIAVALAPRGFRSPPGARVTRVTAAYGGGDDELVVAAAGVAARVGATLRLASFAVHARAPYTVAIGRSADDAAVKDWLDEAETAQRAMLERLRELPSIPGDCEAVVGQGENWEEALDEIEWEGGDVLVVGSSSIGPLARVFLGSRASKIVQNAPVPVVLVPRGVVAELADEAQSAVP